MTTPCPHRAALVAAAISLLAAAPAAAEGWAPPAFAGLAPATAPATAPAPLAAEPWASPAFTGTAPAAVVAAPAAAQPALPLPLAPPADLAVIPGETPTLPQAAPAPGDAAGGAPEHLQLRERIVSAARALLGRPFRGDCSGFVLTLLRKVGLHAELPPARSRSEALFLGGEQVDDPQPGDLAFFHDTYDRNHDGRLNDRWTHVALVERVEGPLVWLVHRGIHGIERIRMDLAHPSDRAANDRLRIPKQNEPPGTRHLAGELLTGFGAVAP